MNKRKQATKTTHTLQNNILTTRTKALNPIITPVTTWAELQKAQRAHQQQLLRKMANN